jgi:TonB family protein
MFDMLLESGHRPSLLPSWGKGVAVALHVVIVGALWRAPAPHTAVVTGTIFPLPPLEPTSGKDQGSGPVVPIVVVDGPPTLPPPDLPMDVFKPLGTPVIDPGGAAHSAGGPVLEPGDSVYRSSLVQDAPELLAAPTPVYPPLLRAAGVQGQVMVSAVVDTLGQAENGSVRIVLSDNPGFDAAALATVRAARFRPARIYGRAVRVLVQVPVVFRLN